MLVSACAGGVCLGEGSLGTRRAGGEWGAALVPVGLQHAAHGSPWSGQALISVVSTTMGGVLCQPPAPSLHCPQAPSQAPLASARRALTKARGKYKPREREERPALSPFLSFPPITRPPRSLLSSLGSQRQSCLSE